MKAENVSKVFDIQSNKENTDSKVDASKSKPLVTGKNTQTKDK